MNLIKEIGKLVHDDSSAHFINADMAYVSIASQIFSFIN